MTTAQTDRVELAKDFIRLFYAAAGEGWKLLNQASNPEEVKEAIRHLDKSGDLWHQGIGHLEFAAGFAPYKGSLQHPQRKA